MKLKPEQVTRLRKPFDAVDAFKGKSQEEVEQILNEVMEYYLSLARIHLRSKNKQANENQSTHHR